MPAQIASRKASDLDPAAYPDSSNSLLEGTAVTLGNGRSRALLNRYMSGALRTDRLSHLVAEGW